MIPPRGSGRVVVALEVIEEAELSDPEEDVESEYVAGGRFLSVKRADVVVG